MLEKLVRPRSCKYPDGRAENARKMREGVSGRTAIATARSSLNAIGGDAKDCRGAWTETNVGEAEHLMPHLAFSGVELEELYPRLAALADEHMDDPAVDMSDLTLQVGQRIAEDIRATMRTEGRRHRIQ